MNASHRLKIIAIPENSLTELVAKAIGEPYEILPYTGFGSLLPNGSWTGAAGLLLRQEVDMAILPALMNDNKANMEISFPFRVEGITFMTRKAQTDPRFSAIFHPFRLEAWLAVIVSSITIALIHYAMLRKKCRFGDILMSLFALLLHQSASFKHRSQRLLTISWLLGVTFLTCCYASILLSVLTFPPASKVRDIDHLSKAFEMGRYEIMPRNNRHVAAICESRRPSVKIICDTFLERPPSFGQIPKFVEKSRNTSLAFIHLRGNLDILGEDYFISDDYFTLALIGIPVRKAFCCKERLNLGIHRITSSGLFQKQFNDLYQKRAISFALAANVTDHSERPLALSDLSGAFLVWAGGMSIALLTLLIEMLVKRCGV